MSKVSTRKKNIAEKLLNRFPTYSVYTSLSSSPTSKFILSVSVSCFFPYVPPCSPYDSAGAIALKFTVSRIIEQSAVGGVGGGGGKYEKKVHVEERECSQKEQQKM